MPEVLGGVALGDGPQGGNARGIVGHLGDGAARHGAGVLGGVRLGQRHHIAHADEAHIRVLA